mmetsp:Transcript_21740/g.52569  ORF Transcript_21740/g.52569 Transcript_21740/m.52569 type:complete len:125 (+) Transcript_21740:1236-1610(+)
MRNRSAAPSGGRDTNRKRSRIISRWGRRKKIISISMTMIATWKICSETIQFYAKRRIRKILSVDLLPLEKKNTEAVQNVNYLCTIHVFDGIVTVATLQTFSHHTIFENDTYTIPATRTWQHIHN